MTLKDWVWNIAIGVDAAGSAICRGSPVITLSARAATARRDGRLWGRVLCPLLNTLFPNHIANAVKNNRARLAAALDELEGL